MSYLDAHAVKNFPSDTFKFKFLIRSEVTFLQKSDTFGSLNPTDRKSRRCDQICRNFYNFGTFFNSSARVYLALGKILHILWQFFGIFQIFEETKSKFFNCLTMLNIPFGHTEYGLK